MGSWYETCGVSNLPIMDDDEVVLFILEKTNISRGFKINSFMKTTDLYDPICLPIFGKYTGYGDIKDIIDEDDLVYNHMINLLQLNPEFNKEVLSVNNIEDLISQIERDSFNNLNFMLVHKKLYSELVDTVNNQKSYYNETTTKKEELFNTINDYKTNDELNNLSNELLYSNIGLPNDYIDCTDGRFEYYRDPSLINEKFKNKFVDYISFYEVMATSRIMWTPQIGSQDMEIELPRIIADFMVETTNRFLDEEY